MGIDGLDEVVEDGEEKPVPGLDEEVLQKSEVSSEADGDDVLEGVEEVDQSKEEPVDPTLPKESVPEDTP